LVFLLDDVSVLVGAPRSGPAIVLMRLLSVTPSPPRCTLAVYVLFFANVYYCASAVCLTLTLSDSAVCRDADGNPRLPRDVLRNPGFFLFLGLLFFSFLDLVFHDRFYCWFFLPTLPVCFPNSPHPQEWQAQRAKSSRFPPFSPQLHLGTSFLFFSFFHRPESSSSPKRTLAPPFSSKDGRLFTVFPPKGFTQCRLSL